LLCALAYYRASPVSVLCFSGGRGAGGLLLTLVSVGSWLPAVRAALAVDRTRCTANAVHRAIDRGDAGSASGSTVSSCIRTRRPSERGRRLASPLGLPGSVWDTRCRSMMPTSSPGAVLPAVEADRDPCRWPGGANADRGQRPRLDLRPRRPPATARGTTTGRVHPRARAPRFSGSRQSGRPVRPRLRNSVTAPVSPRIYFSRPASESPWWGPRRPLRPEVASRPGRAYHYTGPPESDLDRDRGAVFALGCRAGSPSISILDSASRLLLHRDVRAAGQLAPCHPLGCSSRAARPRRRIVSSSTLHRRARTIPTPRVCALGGSSFGYPARECVRPSTRSQASGALPDRRVGPYRSAAWVPCRFPSLFQDPPTAMPRGCAARSLSADRFAAQAPPTKLFAHAFGPTSSRAGPTSGRRRRPLLLDRVAGDIRSTGDERLTSGRSVKPE